MAFIDSQKSTLKFQSIGSLVDFAVFIDSSKFFINRRLLTITGEFTQADIELAKNGYGAIEVQLET